MPIEKFKRGRESGQIDMAQLLQELWNKKIFIICIGFFCAAATLLFTIFCITPQYKAGIMFYVNNSNISLGNSQFSISQSDLNAAQSLVDTYIVILNTRETKEAILEELGEDKPDLLNNISANAVNSTEIFRVTVTGESPEMLQKIAKTIGDVLPKRISDTVEGSDVRIVNHAYLYAGRESPSYSKNTFIGLFVGLFFSSVFFILKDLMDNTVRSEEYLNDLYNVPILTVVSNFTNENKTSKYMKYKSQKEIAEEEDGTENEDS